MEKERDLQKEFNQWSIDNELEKTISFSPEQREAYRKGKTIQITKGKEEELIIKPKEEGISIKYIQSLDNIKNKLEDEDIKKLLEGETVTKLNSFKGKITSIEDNHVVLSNEFFGQEKIPLKNLNVTEDDVGKTIAVERFIAQKETENGEKYNIDLWKESNEKTTKVSYSSYEADEYMRVHEINPEDVVNGIKSINGIDLSQKNKLRLLKGKKVNLEDNEEMEISPKAKKGFTAKKALLIGFALSGGPISYLLYKSIKIGIRKKKEMKIKELENLEKAFKKEQGKYPTNKSLQEEYQKQKSYTQFIKEDDTTNAKITILNEENKKGESFVVEGKEKELFDNIKEHFDKNPKDIIVLEIKNNKGKNMAEIGLTADSVFMEDKTLFESAINTQNAKLFENRNKKTEEITELIEKTEKIIERKDLHKKIELDRKNVFENYLKSLKAIALQKARAYPENARIRNDINILDKNINMINNVSFKKSKMKQHHKAHATGVNDPDLFEDSLREQKEEKKEGRTRKRDQYFRSRSM